VLQFLSQHDDEQGYSSSLSVTIWSNGTRPPCFWIYLFSINKRRKIA